MCDACEHDEEKAKRVVGLNPYGANKPSPLRRPTGTGTRHPKPKLPEGFPRYLKPIPVNTRNIERLLQAQIASSRNGLQRWLYSTWTAQAEALKYQEIRNAIREGDISQAVLRRWHQDYAAFIEDKLKPQWVAAMSKAGNAMSAAAKRSLGLYIQFNEGAERLRRWTEFRSTELAVNLTKLQHDAMRSVITELGVQQGMGPEALARYIRPLVGLTPQQTAAVAAKRAALIAEKTPPAKVVNLTENYAAFLHRQRASNIARTELSFAFNQGALEQMRQINDSGKLGDPIVKTWLAAETENTCEFCIELNGQSVALEDTFPGASAGLPNVYTPPAHTSCICTLIYQVASATGKPLLRAA